MLTDAHRAYLKAAREAGYLFTQVQADLTHKFGLTPTAAGMVLAQDLKEQA